MVCSQNPHAAQARAHFLQGGSKRPRKADLATSLTKDVISRCHGLWHTSVTSVLQADGLQRFAASDAQTMPLDFAVATIESSASCPALNQSEVVIVRESPSVFTVALPSKSKKSPGFKLRGMPSLHCSLRT